MSKALVNGFEKERLARVKGVGQVRVMLAHSVTRPFGTLKVSCSNPVEADLNLFSCFTLKTINHFSRSYLPFVSQDTSFQIKKSKKILLALGWIRAC